MEKNRCTLTAAELNVLQTAVFHITSDPKDLARILGRSRHTVRKQLDVAMEKLGVHSRFEAAIYLLETGVICLKRDADPPQAGNTQAEEPSLAA